MCRSARLAAIRPASASSLAGTPGRGGNSDFVWALTRNLAGNVVGSPVHPDFFDMREIGWRRAALLPRDPDYVKRRASRG